MEKLMLTAVAAIAGGLIGHFCKIPSGAMIGSMLGVALLNIFWNKAALPPNYAVVLQIAAGAMVGTRITMDTVASLKNLVVPVLIIVFGVVVINFALGLAISRFSSLDITTAMFSSSPGGMTEMALAADSLGADISIVALLQLIRLLTTITLMPPLLRFFLTSGWAN